MLELELGLGAVGERGVVAFVDFFTLAPEWFFENVKFVQKIECETGSIEALASLLVLWADAFELVRQHISPYFTLLSW